MKDISNISVGERILLLRTENGYTREYLSRHAEISSKFLYEIETGKKGFSAHTLVKLSQALGVSMDYIMMGHGERKCDQEIAVTLERFEPRKVKAAEQLLSFAYKLLSDAEKDE